MPDEQVEFPLALSRFAARLPVGHPDHIWLGPLVRFHKTEKHTLSEWHDLIAEMKQRPVPRD